VLQARRAVENSAIVVISRGGTALAIQRSLPDVAVVEIPVTAFDLFRAVRQARQHADHLVVVGHKQFTDGFQGWEDLLKFSPLFLTLDASDDAEEAHLVQGLENARTQGFDFVVGDTVSTRVAERVGMRSILVESGPEAIVQAIREAERVAALRTAERDRTAHIRCITDHAHEGIISIDGSGTVQIFNPSAEKILGLPAWRVVGRKLKDVLEGFEVHTGKPGEEAEVSTILEVRGKTLAAHIVRVSAGQALPHTIATFQEAASIQKMEHEIRRNLHARGLIAEYTFEDIVGSSSCIRRVKQEATEYARSDSAICIFGETGTGKELFAQAIHNASGRKGKPFVAFNCAAFPETLQESELFGYAEGAFTGARRGGKPGLFEQAHGGSVFLDEVDELSASAQALLLRVLQERKVRRIADDKVIPVDVRIIVATNENLEALMDDKRFRTDLFYRINVLNLRIPPLRERPEDIPMLVSHFFTAHSFEARVRQVQISSEGIALLQQYKWPGNIRQLRNIIERLAAKSQASAVSTLQVREAISVEPGSRLLWETPPCPAPDSSNGDTLLRVPQNARLEEIEKAVIDQMIAACNGNRARAAELLGISRTTMWRRTR